MALNDASKLAVIFMLIILNRCSSVAAQDGNTVMVMNIGVFVDPSTRTGREQTIGLEIAAEDFNNKYENNKVELHFRNSTSSNDPLQAPYSAIELVKEKKIEAIIIGTENTEEVALMGEIANEYKVPLLSLSVSLQLQMEKQHSFLVQMANNYRAQIKCITSMIHNFGWKKVIAVYEDGGNHGIISPLLDLFSQELQGIGSEIEYRLALPHFSSMPMSKELIIEELTKVFSIQSRVFVVLDSSSHMAAQLFKEASNIGLVGRETAWIVTDSIASQLDALNFSTRSYMEGILGIKTHFDEYNQNFMAFTRAFLLKMIAKYPNEQSFHPGIHALRAYDAITTIGDAFDRERHKEISISPGTLLQEILLSNFTGLSGKISLKDGSLEDVMLYRIVNVVGKSYKELDFWTPKIGFFKNLRDQNHCEISDNENCTYNNILNGKVNWPGDIDHVPKGYTVPSTIKPLKIGIPGNPPFDKFVIVETWSNNKTSYSGFCIDVFLEVVKIIEQSYGLPYEFEVYNGTYDELVDRVHDKTFDAAVGDITILANRSNYVEFTQPYTKSGLSMIVPLKSKDSHKGRMLMKPFTWKLWLVTLATLLYTIFGVWWIESRIANNSDFQGNFSNQLNAALWYTFSSIFHVQGLSMIVPLKSKDSHKGRMLMKPFSWKLWLVTLATLLYTIFGVWWIESRIPNNSDFQGSFISNQLNVALWYTFSSIFHAQRENIRSNLTRALVAAWMLVVFVLTSSYTASLSAMLTVPLLEPTKVKNIEWLKKTNSQIGCDGGSVWDYLVNVQGFKPENIRNISNQYEYEELFDNNIIVAAFLELPYQKLLVNQYCKSFTHKQKTYGFGAQGFVFQKGSPIIDDVSKAILNISENGVLKELENKWLSMSECSTSSNDNAVERLHPNDFLPLYIIYGIISVICLLSSVAYMVRRYRAVNNAISSGDWSYGRRFFKFMQFYHGGIHRNSQITPITENSRVSQTGDCDGHTLELSTYTDISIHP